VKKWGKPETPDQLSDHSLITYAPGNPINDWHFMVDNQQKILRARGTLAMNNGDSVLQTVLAGGGLAMLAAFMAGEHVKTGKLVTLLDEYVREDVPIYAVYPSGRHLSPKVRAFVDFLVELYGPSPYWL
jgi:DNA-binding transcriptional LysR family regulator